ncbi:uncharacterized protein FA14DRAFT_157616 [Meira miltonrushii]|uniref:Secreted protein n=1 Tax=Meira miltonrushii TaxID=1280837 RepID=A0A316V6S3_9BASI|nr:uncharacterized protein FA14DRAFT_157616 [Meira miltonrushii]PWN32924.1 hypothetical protein FA14DRAFT_157616 [Meira miltonrushii]
MKLSSTCQWILLCTLSILSGVIQFAVSTSDSQDHDPVFGWIPEHENIISQSDLEHLREMQREVTPLDRTRSRNPVGTAAHQSVQGKKSRKDKKDKAIAKRTYNVRRWKG